MSEKKSYNYDKAASLPDTFAAHPPEDLPEQPMAEVVSDSIDTLQTCAIKAGNLISKMSKSEIDMLYRALAPMTKKLAWYESRYVNMQNKISYLLDTVKKLEKENVKFRQRADLHKRS